MEILNLEVEWSHGKYKKECPRCERPKAIHLLNIKYILLCNGKMGAQSLGSFTQTFIYNRTSSRF
jgi:hypothetical protein